MKLLKSNAASWMMDPFCSNVCFVSLFRGGKVPQKYPLSACVDGGSPRAGYRAFAGGPTDANKSAFGVSLGFPLILTVAPAAYIAQVANSVIPANTVDMVNVVDGPSPVNVQPCKSVGFVASAVYINLNVANIRNVSSNASDTRHTPAHKPRKNPGLRVIVQKFAQTFCGKIGLSHDAVLSLIGQRPSGVSALAGLRHFNTGGA